MIFGDEFLRPFKHSKLAFQVEKRGGCSEWGWGVEMIADDLRGYSIGLCKVIQVGNYCHQILIFPFTHTIWLGMERFSIQLGRDYL